MGSVQSKRAIADSSSGGAAPAAELRVLIHEMSNLIDGSLRSLALARRRMEAATDAEPGVERQLECVSHSLERMASLLHSASGERRAGPRSVSPRTFRQLVEETAGILSATAEERQIRIETSVASSIESAPAPALESVMTNVVRNAIDAIGRGGRIDIHATEDAGDVVIRVLDDGCGPPMRVGERIFSPGFTTKPGGSGIGLALVRDIIRGYGGDVRLTQRWESETLGSDEARRGAEVVIRLPLEPTDAGGGVTGEGA